MANVLFKRLEDSSELDNIPIVDGSLYITKDGKTFIDYDDDRIPVGGTPDDEMSDRSSNTVENKVIKKYVDDFIDTINAGFVYSTNEIKTNEKWHNGKDIYRITFISTTSSRQETISLSGLSIEEAFFDSTHSYYTFSSPARNTPIVVTQVGTGSSTNAQTGNQSGIYFASDYSSFTIETGYSWTIDKKVVTIEYTKTTD